jgi:hypothetical protein
MWFLFFCKVTHRCLVESYRTLSTEYCSHLRRLITHETEKIVCAETSGTNYKSTQDNIPDARRSRPDRIPLEGGTFMVI